MHTIALLPLVPLSFIAIAFTEHCKKALRDETCVEKEKEKKKKKKKKKKKLQCTSGTESAEKKKKNFNKKNLFRCASLRKKKLELNCIRERIPSCFAIFYHINFHFEP